MSKAATTRKCTLNDRILKALKPARAGERYELRDNIVPGFRVRITDKGQKSFVLLARYPGGNNNPTRRTIGEYGAITLENGRNTARKWIELLQQGKDPREEDERQKRAELRKRANSFSAVAEDFIREKLKEERRGRDVERDIRNEFIPAWGGRPITDISPADVVAIVKSAKNRGAPYQAHSLLATARRLFGWAIAQLEYGLETSPCDRLKPKAIIGTKKPRERTLEDKELRALWSATEKMGYPYGPLVRLLAITGQRKSEVAEARWSEIDLNKRLWTIPAARMKAKAAHLVPLSRDAMAVLETLPRFTKGDYLFSTTYGVKPVNGFSKNKDKLDQLVGFSDWVLHDIRRTMRTGLGKLPVPSDVAELVIAHTKPGLHKVYNLHTYEKEKREALELWAGALRDIVTPPPANVVKLRQKKRARS